MPLKILCSSHVHLMDYPGLVGDAVLAEVRSAMDGHRALVEDYDPQLVIKIGDDHASGFSLSLMPPFTIGVRAYGVGDFNCSAGALSTDETQARELISYLHEQGVDVAHSYRLQVDHGIVQLLDHYFGGIARIPVIPIVINCGGDLRPPLARTRELGRMLGRFVREQLDHMRVLIIGSGGMSHDPPLPVFVDSPPDVQQRLIDAPPEWTPELMAARVQRVLDAAREHGRGEGALKPLNPAWDGAMMDLFAARDLDALCGQSDSDVIEQGGRGGSEIRNWIASFAAMDEYSGGNYVAHKDYYRPVPAWVVGLSMMHAEVADG